MLLAALVLLERVRIITIKRKLIMKWFNWLIMGWVPAISTTMILTLVLWLSKNLIITRLTNSVRHEYDKKIESLKTTLRLNEESFKAELRIKESQIEALRNGALLGVVNRQALLYERQLTAIELIWNGVVSLASAKKISELMTVINFDVAIQEAKDNPRAREAIAMSAMGLDSQNIKTIDESKIRPFINPLAWSLYSAYRTIIMHEVIKFQMLTKGVDLNILDTEALVRLVKIALPNQTSYIEKNSGTLHFLLEELESRLLIELRKILKGEESDMESLEMAQKILNAADEVMNANSKASDSLNADK